MKTITVRMPYKNADVFDLYLIGDIHLGAAACDERLLAKTIEEIRANDRAIVFIMGDVIDAVGLTGSDRRSDYKTLAKWAKDTDDSDIFQTERDMAVKYLSPIAGKIAAWVMGNHEDAIEHMRGFNIYWDMVSRTMDAAKRNPADVALGYEGFVNLIFRQNYDNSGGNGWQMTSYLHHGFGGGRKPGSHANNLFDLMGTYQADLHAVGHTHTMISVPREIVTPGRGGTPARTFTRWGVVSGSFLRAHLEPSKNGKPRNTYAQIKGLPPLPINYPIVHVRPRERLYDIEFRQRR